MKVNEGQIVTVIALLTEIAAAVWNVHLGKDVDLGPGGLGGGLAAILTAGTALLAAPPAARALLAQHQRKPVEKDHE